MGPEFMSKSKSAGQAPVGNGMARQGMRTLQSRPYQLHVQEMRAQGLEPMSPEQFLMQQQGG